MAEVRIYTMKPIDWDRPEHIVADTENRVLFDGKLVYPKPDKKLMVLPHPSDRSCPYETPNFIQEGARVAIVGPNRTEIFKSGQREIITGSLLPEEDYRAFTERFVSYVSKVNGITTDINGQLEKLPSDITTLERLHEIVAIISARTEALQHLGAPPSLDELLQPAAR